jgi:monooxygenase
MKEPAETLDVLIVGAGISGIGMAYNMLKNRKQDSFAVIESRDNIGGTWDFFKYPGLRSDSDMYTFAYSFKPWRHREYIGSAQRIKSYLDELVEENNIKEKIRFQTRITSANWDSSLNVWKLQATRGDGSQYDIHAKFFITCTGYYNYQQGYLPKFEEFDRFKGDIIHPQKWPKDYNYKDKKVIVIGSGATAFTIVPTMAKEAAHVTMLQRSPGYVYNRPSSDVLFRVLSKYLPANATNKIMRIKHLCFQQLSYGISKGFPKFAKKMLIDGVRQASDNKLDVKKHFTPNYQPWDQRVCMVPDNDMFEAVKCGKVSVETEHIQKFTEKGILLKNGQELEADLIVTATGLDLQLWGGMELKVDDAPVVTSNLTNYKGMMFSQLPNTVMVFGYTNASWTIKAELSYDYICRLLNFMDKNNHKSVFPYLADDSKTKSLVSLESGYVLRAQDKLPKQGESFPWCNKDFYFSDLLAIKHSKLDDGVLKFDDNSALASFHTVLDTPLNKSFDKNTENKKSASL